VSPDHAFDQSHGNLFVTRIAGNFVTNELLASLEYGVGVLGASVIFVLGHTDCGAIKAAIHAEQAPGDFHGSITSILTKLKPAVSACTHENHGIWKINAIKKNVLNNINILKTDSALFKEKSSKMNF